METTRGRTDVVAWLAVAAGGLLVAVMLWLLGRWLGAQGVAGRLALVGLGVAWLVLGLRAAAAVAETGGIGGVGAVLLAIPLLLTGASLPIIGAVWATLAVVLLGLQRAFGRSHAVESMLLAALLALLASGALPALGCRAAAPLTGAP